MFGFFKRKARAATGGLIEIDGSNIPSSVDIAHLLTTGNVLVFRDVPEIHAIRNQIIDCSNHFGGQEDGSVSLELTRWLNLEETPSIEAVLAFSRAVKAARNTRYLPYILEKFVRKLGLPEPARLHHGMPRVIFPAELIDRAKTSGMFDEEDFKRKDANGYGEFFMPGPSNIHRDFNRWHSVLMCNLWFTLHDAAPDEVIRVWPQEYTSGLGDIDNTPKNSNKLSLPLQFSLKAGDAVLFHSEQLHASPKVGHTRRRFSFDIRVAADSRDDNAHYRKDFWDVRDFASGGKGSLAAWMQAGNMLLKPSEMCAVYWLNKLEDSPQEVGANIDALKNIIHDMEYAEDFLIAVARLTRNAVPDFADACLIKVIKESNLLFFLLDASRELIACGKVAEAKEGLEKIIELGVNPLPDYTPIDYKDKQVTQILPPDMVRQARELLNHLVV